MAFGIIIIGDEILSGRRAYRHLAKLIELLGARGLALAWAEYVGDDPQRITATLRRTLASGDIVFSTGGIGATPDDHTRQCAAAALEVPLELHSDAKAAIRERIRDMHTGPGPVDYDTPENLHRLNMGMFPQGAAIIPNAYNKIPGFSVREHYFVPGFPVMAWPMIAWVLDTKYAHLHHRSPHAEQSLLVFHLAESTLTPLMEQIERDFPGVHVFSLPSVGDAERGGIYARHHIDLGVKGEPQAVEAAFVALREGVQRLGGEIIALPESTKTHEN
jgi:molybdopterin-biosynthesis enzyme MoeA-like protein